MRRYDSIPGADGVPFGTPCIAFVKYDGSNLRWEWRRRKGFVKQGSRHRLFDATDAQFGAAVPLFREIMAGPLEEALTAAFGRGIEEATFFTEWFGPSSFAGQHVAGEAMELRLFDVAVSRRGLLGPARFLDAFGHLPFAAETVFRGVYDAAFVEEVRVGAIPSVVEGVVVKAGDGHRLRMGKVKTRAWLERLRERFGEGWEALA